jgi:hypothetical protein
MEIGLIYSRKDPVQTEASDFVKRFVRERGILAKIIESDQPVKSPTVIINGQALRDQRKRPREKNPKMYPTIQDIAHALERHIWSI